MSLLSLANYAMPPSPRGRPVSWCVEVKQKDLVTIYMDQDVTVGAWQVRRLMLSTQDTVPNMEGSDVRVLVTSPSSSDLVITCRQVSTSEPPSIEIEIWNPKDTERTLSANVPIALVCDCS